MSKLKIPVTLTSGINQPVVEASEVKDVSFNKNQSEINEDTGRAIGNINNLVVGEDNLVDAINVNSNSIVTLDENKANKVDVQTALDLKADKGDLDNYVDDASYNSSTKKIELRNKKRVGPLAYIDATAFIKDGMVSSVVIDNGYLVITFNTDSGKEPIRLALTDIFNPDNYYTKNVVDSKLGSLEFPTGDNNVTDAINTTIRNLTIGLDNLNTIKADKTEVDEKLAQKANTDGWYPRMVVGAAESIIGKDISVDEATDYVVQGATGIAKVNEVMGRSEKWNQLVRNSNFADGTTDWRTSNSTIAVQNNILTLTSGSNVSGSVLQQTNGNVVSGHKYLFCAVLTHSVQSNVTINFATCVFSFSAVPANSRQVLASITTFTGTAGANLNIYPFANTQATGTQTAQFELLQCSDLTDIYGEGNEPTTVEQFAADVFTKYGKTLDEYFEYDAGSINNANVEKLDITGFNQWNEQWELGSFDTQGNPIASSLRLRSKNFIPVIGGTTYHFILGAGSTVANILLQYDANYELVLRQTPPSKEFTRTLEPSTAFIKFAITNDYGTTYKNDVCINISDATKNGTYEPYKHTELPINIKTITGKVNGEGESVTIFPDGMHGVGTAYDSLIVDEDGWCRRAVRRVGSVDLGSFTWSKRANLSTVFYISPSQLGAKPGVNYLSSKYIKKPTSPITSWAPDTYIQTNNDEYRELTISSYNGESVIFNTANDSNYGSMTQDEFKAAMNGVELIYELKTPIEYVLDTPILMTFNAYNGGVIRQVKGDMELATRINITFALNVQGFINNANKAYISAASMQAFLTKLSSAKGGTWGMTYNSTTQQYEFTYNQ